MNLAIEMKGWISKVKMNNGVHVIRTPVKDETE